MTICIVVPTLNNSSLYDREPPRVEVLYQNKQKDKIMFMDYEPDISGVEIVIGGMKYDVKRTFDMGDDGIFTAFKWRFRGDLEWKEITKRYL